MATQSGWTERLARSVRRRLPASLRGPLGRLRRRGKPSGQPAPALTVTKVPPSTEPVLSVIIPVYNVEPYLAECLDSVRRQSFDDLEVLVIDDGSTDGSRAVLERFVRRDERFRLLEQPNQGQAAARNLAVRQARGEFLTFVDGDDVVPKGAFAAMVKSLRASGSDMVVGAAMRLRNGKLSAPVWNSTVHQRDRLKITIDDFPGALWDVIACNRMFRRAFWVEEVGGFRSGMAYEDHVPMVAGYVRARTFDLLSRTTYHWRYRENLTSESQQKHRLDNLRDRLEVKAEAAAMLTAEASSEVSAAWLGRVLDTDLTSFIDFALIADDEYRTMLSDGIRQYRSQAGDEAMNHVRVLQKIRGLLAAESRWEDLVAVQTWFREMGGLPATEVVDGGVYLKPLSGTVSGLELPLEVRELAWHETDLRSCLASAVWSDAAHLELTGWAYPAHVDFSQTLPMISISLVGQRTGAVVECAVEHLDQSEATRWSNQRRAQVDAAAFRASLDLSMLLDQKPDVWQLVVEVRAFGIARRGSFFDALAGSSASAGLLTSSGSDSADLVATPRFDRARGFVIETRRVVAELAAPGTTVDEGRLVGSVTTAGRALPESLVLVQSGAKMDVAVDWLDAGDGRTRAFGIDVSSLRGTSTPTRWDLRRSPGTRVTSGVTWPRSGIGGSVEVSRSHLSWQRSARWTTQVVIGNPPVSALDVEADGDEVTVVVSGADLTVDELSTVELTSSTLAVPLRAVEPGEAGSRRWCFPGRVSRFGLPALPLPPGIYQVSYRDRSGARQFLGADPALRAAVVREWRGPHHRIRLSATADALRIGLSAPLEDDEVGRFAQNALLTRYQDGDGEGDDDREPEEAVLFQSWDGGVAAGDQLALHDAVGTLRPGFTRYWAVADASVSVPAGAVPLILGTRSYVRALARVRYLCGNTDLGPQLRKRTYQRFLQTFDGHPFSSTGRLYWEGRRGHPEAWIHAECTRLNAQWDVVLAPNRLAAELYRSEFDYRGEILAVGSPRCDALVSSAPSRRQAIRRAMGVGDQHIVTLYAPTSRDLLTTRGSTKRRFDELDLVEIATRLGPRHHLWVRGHHDNKRVPDRVSGIEGIRDLTDYPDVNDLMIAADVLLTDYSAIRFDWAVTGKPVVFFVADEPTYFALRPPLFEFAESAPGPRAQTTEEVAELLARPGDLTRKYGSALAEFNTRFNRLQDGGAAARVVEAFFYS